MSVRPNPLPNGTWHTRGRTRPGLEAQAARRTIRPEGLPVVHLPADPAVLPAVALVAVPVRLLRQ